MKQYIRSATNSSEDFEIDGTGVLIKYNGSSENVIVPDIVIEIGRKAFYNDKRIKNVNLPNSVTKIGDDAFKGCIRLTSMNIPDSVTEIGYAAFNGCISLASITIPDNVRCIDYYAFTNCTSLINVAIPNSVTEIYPYAFYNCSSLTSISIPDSVMEIGGQAFRYCTNLKSISLPDSVKLNEYVFEDTPLESKFNKGRSKVAEPEEEEFEYDELDQEDMFVENLEDLVRQNYDVEYFYEDPPIQLGSSSGSDVITMRLNDGRSYEFWFDYRDQLDTIMTDGPESAARQYFAKIKDGIDSGEALVEE